MLTVTTRDIVDVCLSVSSPSPPAVLDHEADTAGERAEPTDYGDCHGKPEGDDAGAGGGDADKRHGDPDQTMRQPEDERRGLRIPGDEGQDEQREIDRRVHERGDLEPSKGDQAHDPARFRQASSWRREHCRDAPERLVSLGRPAVDVRGPPGEFIVLFVGSDRCTVG